MKVFKKGPVTHGNESLGHINITYPYFIINRIYKQLQEVGCL